MRPTPADQLFGDPNADPTHPQTASHRATSRIQALRNLIAECVPWNALATNIVVGTLVTAPLYPLSTLGERLWLLSLFAITLAFKLIITWGSPRLDLDNSLTRLFAGSRPRAVLQTCMNWSAGALAGVVTADFLHTIFAITVTLI